MDITVIVHSKLPEGEAQGKFEVVVRETETVRSFLHKVCQSNGIPLKSSYVLQTQDGHELRWSSSLKESLVTNGTALYLHNMGEEVKMRKMARGFRVWIFLGFVSLAIGAVGLIAISLMYQKNGPVCEYGIVMDAGSSHTTLYVYRWNGQKYHNTAQAHEIDKYKLSESAISSYESNLNGLAALMENYLAYAKNTVPSIKHKSTPIYLGATAGMRLLQEVNESQSDAIMNVIRETIKKYPFKFSDMQARILTGNEEGLFSWITSNYVAGKFGVTQSSQFSSKGHLHMPRAEAHETVGAMDMGGASTQITFYPGPGVQIPEKYVGSSMLYEANYTVYTQSYLCYGINEITRQYQAYLIKEQGYNETVIQDPCAPLNSSFLRNYTDIFEAPCAKANHTNIDNTSVVIPSHFTFEGGSNPELCHSTVRNLFNFSCKEENCTFNGEQQPKVFGSFYAFSNFFYEMSFLNLTQNKADLQKYNTTLRDFCEKSWDQVKDMPVANEDYLDLYCFRGYYILTLLVEGYKFDEESWKNINFVNKLNGTEIGWSLGFMLSESTNILAVGPKEYVSEVALILLCILFGFFVILSIGFFIHSWRVGRSRSSSLYSSLNTYGTI